LRDCCGFAGRNEDGREVLEKVHAMFDRNLTASGLAPYLSGLMAGPATI